LDVKKRWHGDNDRELLEEKMSHGNSDGEKVFKLL
jgi:hypothetical protein